jgi:hypothetical protein
MAWSRKGRRSLISNWQDYDNGYNGVEVLVQLK